MSGHGPVRVEERHRFDELIDARSPAEFAADHIPGAINLPVLDNEQRHRIGILYKEQGAFEARRVGGALVAENLARHLQGSLAQRPSSWKPLVYCWRGGLRSASMVAWLRLVGWDAQQLGGGYKRWRRHVIDTIERIAPQLRLRVICGATGSAKTRVLQALAARGAQVVDLEQLARHKGSLLGALPGQAQPTQKAFETALASAIERLDLRRDVFIEAESRRIGRVALPTSLVERMRGGECAQIVASVESRLGYLLRDYAYLGDDPQALAGLLEPMICLHGRERVQAWQALAEQGRLAELYAQLIEVHYDPLYERSQSAHYHAWASRRRLLAAGLDEAGIEALAGALLEPPRP